MTKSVKKVLTITGVLAAVISLSACTSSEPVPTPKPEVQQENVTQPISVTAVKSDGETYELPLGNVLLINLEDTDAAAWTYTVSNPEIANFQPNDDGSNKLYNPTLYPLMVGETEVTIVNEKENITATFTVQVAE